MASDPREDLRSYREWQMNGHSSYLKRANPRRRRVNLDFLRDRRDAVLNAAFDPAGFMRSLSPIQQRLVGLTAVSVLVAGAGLAASKTEFVQLREGQTLLNNLARSEQEVNESSVGVARSNAEQFAEKLPGYFSPEGVTQLKEQAALAVTSSAWGSDSPTVKGLDGLLAATKTLTAHELDNGKFTEFSDAEKQQIRDDLKRFADSGLASDGVKRAVEKEHFHELLAAVQDLPGQATRAVFELNGGHVTYVSPHAAIRRSAPPTAGR